MMKQIELRFDDIVHLMRGGTLELEQFELILRRDDLGLAEEKLEAMDERTAFPCPPFKPVFGGPNHDSR